MAKKADGDLRNYAVVGAEHRLLEIAEEAARIFAVFPELRAPGRGLDAVRGGSARDASTAKEPRAPRRRRRKMSAEARRRISEAQKARWAKQKSAGGAKKK